MKIVGQFSVVSHYGRLAPVFEALADEWARVDVSPELWAGVVYIHPDGFIFPVDRDGNVIDDAPGDAA